MVQQVCILGATGSIGQSTLKVLSQHTDRYQVYAVTAQSRIDTLAEICQQYRPKIAVVPSARLQEFRTLLQQRDCADVEILCDEEGLIAVAQHHDVDIVMASIVGSAGLLPTLSAIQAGKRVLLANKEALVMSGEIMMNAVRQHQALLLPVDSEHNAIFQSLPTNYLHHTQADMQPKLGVSQILLTASGGPFLHHSLEQLQNVTPEQACKHPNWSMGRKISVDSATLMNKGLELIEACHLFQLDEQYITVVIHPESIIHSMVQYVDGSTLSQMGNPDMCTPIAHALAYPQRIQTDVPALNLFQKQLNFFEPDTVKFPALRLARQAMKMGGTMPTILNASNEIAVDAFLDKKISFLAISALVERVLNQMNYQPAEDLSHILAVHDEAQQLARQFIQQGVVI